LNYHEALSLQAFFEKLQKQVPYSVAMVWGPKRFL